MNSCIQSLFDFCYSDRIFLILIAIILVCIGYVIGTDGHLSRFYWKSKETKQ